MSALLIFLGFIMFVGLVVIHELGHFWLARRNGVEVEEFGIGFPPRAKVLAKKKGTEYTLNWLPLGGFVKLKGEHDADTEPGTFGAASLWAKTKILLAGVAMNVVAAFLLFTLLAVIGMPKIIDNQYTVASDTQVTRRDVLVGFVDPESPAEHAGLEARDRIIEIGEEPIDNIEELQAVTKQHAGQSVDIIISRSGERIELSTPELRTTEEVEASQDTDEPKGHLGVAPTEYVVQRSTWSSPIVALGLMKQITFETFKGLGSALAGLIQGDTAKASSQVSGVIGVGYLLTEGSTLGFQFILLVIAIISLSLAIMNVLPIPALDGGRLFVMMLFRAIKKPLTPRLEEWIHGTGFVALLLLFVLISIVDVNRFF